MSLAPYAARTESAHPRLHPEDEAATRAPFQRDRDRIIHSAAFRKLQYKTQVFVNHEGDFFRTRLTHSIEVAQIARSIARELNLDEDLTEALALAHDLGHTPFGHAGEDALRDAMRDRGGFDHNTQALRIVTKLENRYAEFDGLNLTWHALEGIAKHNGPLASPSAYLAAYDRDHSLELDTHASAEAQVASLSDDIAYHSHDLDDGLRAGLFTFDDIQGVAILGDALARARALRADLSPARLRHETIRRVINTLCTALVAETTRRLEALAPRHSEDIRRAGHPVVAYDDATGAANREIRAFLHARMYRHWRVNRMTEKARHVTASLFSILHRDPRLLPPEWSREAGEGTTDRSARAVADYIAGMTDRFAVDEHRRLTDLSIPG
jgi:dGTPase